MLFKEQALDFVVCLSHFFEILVVKINAVMFFKCPLCWSIVIGKR